MTADSRWVWLTGVGDERVLAFCYVDPFCGPSAKGDVVTEPPTHAQIRAAVDFPNKTVREPERFGLTAVSPSEVLAMGLPKDPPWIGIYEREADPMDPAFVAPTRELPVEALARPPPIPPVVELFAGPTLLATLQKHRLVIRARDDEAVLLSEDARNVWDIAHDTGQLMMSGVFQRRTPAERYLARVTGAPQELEQQRDHRYPTGAGGAVCMGQARSSATRPHTLARLARADP